MRLYDWDYIEARDGILILFDESGEPIRKVKNLQLLYELECAQDQLATQAA